MIKVLIIDDSATVRMILTQGLGMDPEIKVVGSAPDPYVARDLIAQLNPDVLTLDVEMPKMDGIEFLKRVMAFHPMPVIMVSALTEKGKKITLEALEAGAMDYVTKPTGSHGGAGLNQVLGELRQKIKIASKANLKALQSRTQATALPSVTKPFRSSSLAETTDKVIAIGSSTGGTTALRDVLQKLPADTPGIVIVQHITPGFAKMFAERLNDITQMEVREGKDGDRVMTGMVLVAPSNLQTRVVRSGGTYQLECRSGDLVCGHRPSVEVLFQSVAKAVGANAVGVIMTGMGGDGAEGMLAMRKAGARTFGQDEATCVVFGMPKVAWEAGGIEKLVPLNAISDCILSALRKT